MKLTNEATSIGYLKEHTEEIFAQVNISGPMIITQNGEASAVLMGFREYKELNDSIALQKILSIGSKSALEGECESVQKIFADIKKRISEYAR